MTTCILVVDDSPTIRTVVSSILEQCGYEPKVASDGREAYDALASGAVKADLVLLDFLMPEMNGLQFCRALRENKELAETPVVLMSAKADRIRDAFLEQTGALDAITKPFDRQALAAVISNALRRVSVHRTSSARLSDLETADTGENPTVVAEPVPEPTAPLLAGDLGVVPIGAILQLLQSENQTGVLVCTCRSGAWLTGNPSGAEIRATFRNGLIDLVQSSGAGDEFRLGRFFVEEGILAPEEVEEIARRERERGEPPAPAPDDDPMLAAKTEEIEAVRPEMHQSMPTPTSTTETVRDTSWGTAWSNKDTTAGAAWPAQPPRPRPLGMALLAGGKIVESQLRTALTRQSSELLYEVLRWPAGRFELRREPPSELAVSARLGLPVASAVIEGFRRVDEWRALERTLGSFDAVLFRDDIAFGTLDVASLPTKERTVLDAVDGMRTVRAIVSASHQSSFDVCRILVQFLEARVLRRRVG
jgi:CheY-like chemotaxis protein